MPTKNAIENFLKIWHVENFLKNFNEPEPNKSKSLLKTTTEFFFSTFLKKLKFNFAN